MSTPFEVLGLPQSASQDEIRARYLALVRQFPPDKEPDRFAEIRAAYDELSDLRKALEHRMLDIPTESLAVILADLRSQSKRRIPLNDLLALGKKIC